MLGSLKRNRIFLLCLELLSDRNAITFRVVSIYYCHHKAYYRINVLINKHLKNKSQVQTHTCVNNTYCLYLSAHLFVTLVVYKSCKNVDIIPLWQVCLSEKLVDIRVGTQRFAFNLNLPILSISSLEKSELINTFAAPIQVQVIQSQTCGWAHEVRN